MPSRDDRDLTPLLMLTDPPPLSFYADVVAVTVSFVVRQRYEASIMRNASLLSMLHSSDDVALR